MSWVIEAAGETLELVPERAVWWAGERTLLVADIHVGKAAAFRSFGVPVPRGTTRDNLARLDALVERHRARAIVFLGDFLHAKASHAPHTLADLAEWRARRNDLDLVLVRGNHDARAGEPPASLAIRVVDEPYELGPFALAHHPQPFEGRYTLAGHLHPSFRLAGRGGDAVRLPCFWFGDAVAVLPAFGSFTGTCSIRPAADDRLFVVTPERVFPVGAAA